MKFSIIIPAHNSEDYLWRALESIRRQSFTDYELIVVCDACTDDTKALAKIYTDKVIITDYGNDGLARNAGMDAATGDWLLFMDDDDWWLHDYVLAILAEQCTADADFDVLCFGFIMKGIGPCYPLRPNGMIWPNVWSKCWRRSFTDAFRFKKIDMASDLQFVNDVIEGKMVRFGFLDSHLYFYNYMRAGSQTEIASRKESRDGT